MENNKIAISKDNLKDARWQIFSARLDLDMFYHQLKKRETSYNGLAAANSIILAKAWLGEILGVLGYETPYKPVTEIKDIPQTEHSSLFIRKTNEDRLIYLNECREEIARILNKIANWEIENHDILYYVNQAVIKIKDAQFNLGFEIGILKDLNENKDENN